MFLCDSVRNHRRKLLVKEVENAVIDALKSYSQLVNPIAEKIRFGSTKFVAELLKSFQPHEAFYLSLFGQCVEPLDNWHDAIDFHIEDDFRLGHPASSRNFPEEDLGVRNRLSQICYNKSTCLTVRDTVSLREPMGMLLELDADPKNNRPY